MWFLRKKLPHFGRIHENQCNEQTRQKYNVQKGIWTIHAQSEKVFEYTTIHMVTTNDILIHVIYSELNWRILSWYLPQSTFDVSASVHENIFNI